jgi:small-conductance mechanosensitive channel
MSASEQTQMKASKLINDFQDISFSKIALIVVGTALIITLIRHLLPYLANHGPNKLRLYLLGAEPVLRIVFLFTAILWLIPIIFNITVQNFFVIAGTASVAIGFAFKDYVSSIIAGLVAVFERPYRPGDWVKIDDDYGEVRSVGLRAIELQTPADDTVVVPHSRIWTENISNSNDGERTLMCIAHFYLHPDHGAGAMRSALQDVALTSAYLSYAKPVIVIMKEEAWGTHYQLKAYPFDMRDQFLFISDLTERGKNAIREAGGREITAPVAKSSSELKVES